jgi:hypothetical protein
MKQHIYALAANTLFGRPFRAIPLYVIPRPECFRAWAILCSPFGRRRNVQTPEFPIHRSDAGGNALAAVFALPTF